MRTLQDKVAVVTGAGSGIGRALAQELARRGALLALQDVDDAGLAQTVSLLGGGALATHVDVSDEAQVRDGAAAVLDRYGRVDVVVNNAGIAHGGRTFTELPAEDFARVLQVNLWGVVHGSRTYLPHLAARPEATLVNLSSLFGLIGVGRQSAYCTSKFAVRGFTESLRMELRESAPHVRTMVVHPGGVKTAIARNSLRAGQDDAERAVEIAEFDKVLSRTLPDGAARTIVGGILSGRERVLIGPDAKVLDLLARAVPRHYTALLGKVAARTQPAVGAGATAPVATALAVGTEAGVTPVRQSGS